MNIHFTNTSCILCHSWPIHCPNLDSHTALQELLGKFEHSLDTDSSNTADTASSRADRQEAAVSQPAQLEPETGTPARLAHQQPEAHTAPESQSADMSWMDLEADKAASWQEPDQGSPVHSEVFDELPARRRGHSVPAWAVAASSRDSAEEPAEGENHEANLVVNSQWVTDAGKAGIWRSASAKGDQMPQVSEEDTLQSALAVPDAAQTRHKGASSLGKHGERVSRLHKGKVPQSHAKGRLKAANKMHQAKASLSHASSSDRHRVRAKGSSAPSGPTASDEGVGPSMIRQSHAAEVNAADGRVAEVSAAEVCAAIAGDAELGDPSNAVAAAAAAASQIQTPSSVVDGVPMRAGALSPGPTSGSPRGTAVQSTSAAARSKVAALSPRRTAAIIAKAVFRPSGSVASHRVAAMSTRAAAMSPRAAAISPQAATAIPKAAALSPAAIATSPKAAAARDTAVSSRPNSASPRAARLQASPVKSRPAFVSPARRGQMLQPSHAKTHLPGLAHATGQASADSVLMSGLPLDLDPAAQTEAECQALLMYSHHRPQSQAHVDRVPNTHDLKAGQATLSQRQRHQVRAAESRQAGPIASVHQIMDCASILSSGKDTQAPAPEDSVGSSDSEFERSSRSVRTSLHSSQSASGQDETETMTGHRQLPVGRLAQQPDSVSSIAQLFMMRHMARTALQVSMRLMVLKHLLLIMLVCQAPDALKLTVYA